MPVVFRRDNEILPSQFHTLHQGKGNKANIHLQTEDISLRGGGSPLSRTIAELTRAHGNHSLAFFGLAVEQEHFLPPGEKGLVNYRLANNTAIVLGDPVCAPMSVCASGPLLVDHRTGGVAHQNMVGFAAFRRSSSAMAKKTWRMRQYPIGVKDDEAAREE